MSIMRSEYVLQRGAACVACHNKKQRCSAGKPACQACIKANIECTYRPSLKPRSHQLTDRLQELEARLHQITQEKDKSSSGSESRSTEASYPVQTADPTLAPSMSGGYRSHRSKSSRAEAVPGSTMMWTYDRSVSPHDIFQQGEVSPALRQNLIQIFIQNREKCYFDVHVGSFMASLSLPEGNDQALHPALIDAVILVGIYFSRAPSLDRYETVYLAQAQQKLADSYRLTDRLHDFIRASNLITFYHLCKGRYAEAYEQIVASLHMAVTCGMHQIPSSVWRPASPGGNSVTFLPHPRDGVDLGERIHTFWQTFNFDKVVALATSRPAHLKGGPSLDPLLRISTPWPCQLLDYERGNVSDIDQQSIASLFGNLPPTTSKPDTLTSLKTQGLLLVSHAADFVDSGATTPQYIANLDRAIQNFDARLPGLRNGGECGEIRETPGRSPLNHTIALIHTSAHTASLVLHQQGIDVTGRRRCAMAIQGLMTTISELSDSDYGDLFIGLGHLWFVAARILINISHAAQGTVAEQHNQWARVVISAMRRLSMVYFPLGFQVQLLQDMMGPQ